MTTSRIRQQRSTEDTRSNPENGGSVATIHKTDSEEDTWSSTGYNYINPFVHQLHIDNRIDWAKIYVLTVLLLPVRVVGCVLSLLSAWMFAWIGLYGMTLDDLKVKPLSGWRKKVQYVAATAMRMVFASGSFHHITFKGEPASAKEAPILVVAPHSSYVDSIIVVAAGPPSIVAKRETSEIPLLGRIINFAQPIYVQREDPDSRQNTIREIRRRAVSPEDWPQVVIFAEGTCTNRSALIKFKPGAFYPGVPVQPVLLKYPNRYDTFTWTWDGPGVFRLLWLTMSSFYSRCEIEYLPVYRPSEAEKADANLYARNVREVMAKALEIPTSEYSFEDVILMTRAKDMRIPFPGDIVEIERNFHNLGLRAPERYSKLVEKFLTIPNTDTLDKITLSEILKVDHNDVNQLFLLFDHHQDGTVCLKSILLCLLFSMHKNEDIITFLRSITPIYAHHERITRSSLAKIMRHSSGKASPEQIDALYIAIDDSNKGVISFDEFETYTKDLPQYKYLYTKHEQIRRSFEKKIK